MKDLDINNFVDSILTGKAPQAIKNPRSVNEGSVDNYDIENIDLPDSFVNYIIEGKQAKTTLTKEIKKEIEVIRNTPREIKESREDKVERLMKELADIVSRAKSVIQEMTTCGMIGVNLAGPPLVPQKKKGQVVLKDKKKWKSKN